MSQSDTETQYYHPLGLTLEECRGVGTITTCPVESFAINLDKNSRQDLREF